MTSTQDIVSQLEKWSSCDVSDGLSKLGHGAGGFLEGLILRSPEYQTGATKIVGPVFIVKFAPKSDTTAPKVKGNYIDQIPQGSVVFISQPRPHINACYGGLMTLRAKYLGAKGVVIDGSLRDLQEHRDAGFPVFARGVGTTAGNAVCFASETNVDVKLQSERQDATIVPGGYIIADLDGVVFLPEDLAVKVLEIIPELAAADAKCAEAIQGGMSVEEAFSTFRRR